MDDFKNIGRTINLKSSSAAKEEMTFLHKRKMASNHLSGGVHSWEHRFVRKRWLNTCWEVVLEKWSSV